MITISWFTLLMLFGALLGAFLLLSFALNTTVRRTPGFGYLFGLICLLTIGQIGRLFYEAPLRDAYPRFMLLPDFLLLSFGPLLYLYLRRRFTHTQSWREDWPHLLPVAIYSCVLLGVMLWAPNRFFVQTLLGGKWLNGLYGWMMVALMLNSWYAWRMTQLIRAYAQELDKGISYVAESIQFFNILSWVFISDLLLWFSLIVLGWSQAVLIGGLLAYGVVWLFLCGSAYLLAFYAISNPQVFQVSLHPKKQKYPTSALTSKQILLLKTQVDMLMTTKKLHLNRTLSKSDVLAELDISSSDLSRVFSEGFGMNFFEYVNVYRVKEFIALVESGKFDHLSLMGIANEAGFNSKATFYKAFKTIIGKTPKAYFSQHIP